MDKDPIVFIDGFNFQAVPPTAPETVRGKIYIDWKKFKSYAEENVNEKGYINIKMMKSMKTQGIYFIKDSYVPKTDTQETKDYNESKYKINAEVSQKLFNSPLSDEENQRLADVPF